MKHQNSFSTETVYFSQMYGVKDIAELFDKNNKQNSFQFYFSVLSRPGKKEETRQHTPTNEL